MKRELVQDALDRIDEDLIQEALSFGLAVGAAPERKNDMELQRYRRQLGRRIAVLALAACLLLAFGITACAADLWGIREMFGNAGKSEMPEAAAEQIRQHQETARDEGWSARVTETYCDESTVMVSVLISGGEQYLIAPTDAMPEDPLWVIGREGDGTLAEYASARGRTLLTAGAVLEQATRGEGLSGNSQRFESLSDSEMLILITSSRTVAQESMVLTVNVTGLELEKAMADSEGNYLHRLSIPVSVSSGSSRELGVFAPEDPDGIPGLRLEDMSILETPLGYSFALPYTVTDQTAFEQILSMDFEQLRYAYSGGTMQAEDGRQYALWSMGDGELSDTLTVRFFDWDKETVGTVVYHKK